MRTPIRGRSLLRRPPEDQHLELVLGREIGRGHLEFRWRDFSHAVTAEADQGTRIALVDDDAKGLDWRGPVVGGGEHVADPVLLEIGVLRGGTLVELRQRRREEVLIDAVPRLVGIQGEAFLAEEALPDDRLVTVVDDDLLAR